MRDSRRTNPHTARRILGDYGSSGGGSLSSLRLIGTRTSVPEEFLDQPQLYAPFAFFARDNITSLRVVWSHWYGNGVSPGAGKNLTVEAELEYPAGVYTPITFNGASTKTTGPLTNITSDAVKVSIPNGAIGLVRGLYTGCCNLHRGPNATIGEGSVFPATGLNLVTARSATFNANFFYSPSAIIGTTNKRSVMILGDSRPSGLGDVYTRADGSYGNAGGALNAYAWAQMVQWGGKASDYLAGVGALQDELVAYATDVVCELGVNDLWNGGAGGTNAAAVLATLAALRARYGNKRFHGCTAEPISTSTDSFATLLNQTVFYNNTQLQVLNAALLANGMGYDKPLDFAAISESSLGSGKWKVDGTTFKYTGDGIHQSGFGYGLYPGAGITL
jgi:hypothetical protein